MSWTKIERHVKIKQYNSPFDASLKAYFDKRDEKIFNRENTNAKRKLAKKSRYKCRICGESLQGIEPIESNHIVPVVIGGVDSYDNLELLHKSCHKTHHVLLENYGEGKKLPKVVNYLESNGIKDVNSKKAINLMKRAFKKFRY